MMETIPRAKVLQKESTPSFWNSFSNATVEFIYKPDWDSRSTQHASTYPLFTSYIERNESRLKSARTGSSLYVWVGLHGPSLSLNILTGEDRYLPATGGRYLLISQNCPDQIDHSDFEVKKGKRPVVFVFCFGPEAITLLVGRELHTYVEYKMREKKKLLELLQIEGVKTFQFSVLANYGYLQHAGYSWRSHHGLW